MFQKYDAVENGSPAVLATASNSIKVPIEDFQEIAITFNKRYSDMKSDGKIIRGSKSCNYYKFDNLTLTIGVLDFEIPPFLYTQTVDQRCEIMIEINDETSEKQDDIQTEDDGKDYVTSSGYILGTPFLRAFMILLDVNENKIGFANKINNFGAEILGEGAPGPVRPKNDHDKHDDETIPDDNKSDRDKDDGQTD